MQIEVAGNGPNRLERGSAFKLSVCSKQPEKRNFKKIHHQLFIHLHQHQLLLLVGPARVRWQQRRSGRRLEGVIAYFNILESQETKKQKHQTVDPVLKTESASLLAP